MSKFFAAQDSQSSSSEEEETQEQVQTTQVQAVQPKKRMMSDSEDEDDHKRVILSEKQKKFGKMNDIQAKMAKKIRLEDFQGTLKDLEELNKIHARSEALIKKEGEPDCYVQALVDIQDWVDTMTAEKKQKLSRTNNTALSSLKQKMRKLVVVYAEQMAALKERLAVSRAEEEKKKELKRLEEEKEPLDPLDYLDSSQDQLYFLESDDDEFGKPEEDDGDNSDQDYQDTNDPAIRRLRWLKKAPKDEKDKEEDRKRMLDEKEKLKMQKQKEIKARQQQNERSYENIGYKKKEAARVDKTQAEAELKKIVSDRIKSPENNEENLLKLDNILGLFPDQQVRRLEIIMVTFAVRFDLSKAKFPLYMTRDYWLQQVVNLEEALCIVQGLSPQEVRSLRTYQDEQEFRFEEASLRQLLANQFETLEIEINKAFRNFETVHLEYAQRLKDLPCLLQFGRKIFEWFQQQNDTDNLWKVAYLLLVNTYYLQQEQVDKIKAHQGSSAETFYSSLDLSLHLRQYMAIIMQATQLEGKNKIRSRLCMIYHQASHGEYQEAKDAFLGGRLTDLIGHQDSQIQVLFNRCVVQLGLAAFRQGHYQDSLQWLNDLCSLQKTKELLGQGLSKQSPNEKEERKRQTLLHHYINVDLVDTVFLLDCMLHEALSILQDPYDQKKFQNKSIFRKFLEFYEKNHHFTEPETNKELVLAATKELVRGRWEEAMGYLGQFKFWSTMQDTKGAQDKLRDKVKALAIQAYLIYNKNSFENIQLSFLQGLFGLEAGVIRSVVAKLIYAREVAATLDEHDSLVFEHNDVSQLQRIAQQFSEKLSQQLSHNERIYDSKFGGDYMFNKEEIPESILQAKATKQKQANKKKQTKAKQTNRKKK